MSPVAHESHFDRFVRQFESLFCGQELADFETVELLCRLEEAEYADLELIIVHWCEGWPD